MLLTVTVIFEDPGVQELIVKIYHNGKITFFIFFIFIFEENWNSIEKQTENYKGLSAKT